MDAMEISSYNKNRSIKDVDGRKYWIHGKPPILRPDSLWADERYINVTEEEIAEAKKRVQARLDAKGIKPNQDLRYPKPIPKDYEIYNVDKPLFEGS